jgi:hypothetical protein
LEVGKNCVFAVASMAFVYTNALLVRALPLPKTLKNGGIAAKLRKKAGI